MKRRHLLALSSVVACVAAVVPLHGQLSLQSAVNLALKNSPKVRVAQAELAKAEAGREEARDAYIPVISTQAGYGQATGAPLNVPVIFNIGAQSLVFSFSQRDYMRSANEGVKAAELMLHSTQVEVVEDVTNVYLTLDSNLERQQVLRESLGVADRLITITSDRITAGVDAKVELPRSRRTATQLRLAALQVDDDIAGGQQHLAQLTGLPAQSLTTDRASVPTFATPGRAGTTEVDGPDSDGIRAAFAAARAKQYIAFGDKRYLLRPQVSLAANYSRVDTGLSSYASYYPRYQGTATDPNSQNSLSFGLQFSIPLLDMAHHAKAKASAADAARAYASADDQRAQFREGRAKLRNAARELDLRAQLARDDREIAQDQLETIQLQMQQVAGGQGQQVTPKDQLNAQLQERQKYLDVLAADLQLRETQVSLLRQTGGLGDWILQGGAGPATLRPVVVPGSPAAAPGAPLAPPTNPLPAAPAPNTIP